MKKDSWLEQFHLAIKDRSSIEVRRILQWKPDDISVDDCGDTCIGNVTALDYLLSHKLTSRDKGLVKFLLESGANPSKLIQRNNFIEHFRKIFMHDDDIVILLLEHMMDRNSPSEYKHIRSYVMNVAVETGRKAVVEYCLKRKANVNKSIAMFFTPLTLVVHALGKYCIGLAKILLKYGADVNSRTLFGRTSLHKALLLRDSTDLINVLLQYKPDMNVKCHHGHTPLYTYIKVDLNLKIIKKLLAAGSDPNIPGRMENNALHYLAMTHPVRENCTKAAEILIANGASVNYRNAYGLTPLHIATIFSSNRLVEYFLNHGADPNIRSQNGMVAIEYSESYQMDSVFVRNLTLQAHLKNMVIGPQCLAYIESSDRMMKMKELCENELNEMRNKEILDTNISYYKLLTSPPSTIARFARNKSTHKILKEIRACESRNYGRRLKVSIGRGLRRRKLEDQFLYAFKSTIGIDLPVLCLQNIADKINDESLVRFSNTFDRK